jgi:hypothetical protein
MFRSLSIAVSGLALLALAGTAQAQVLQGNVIHVDPGTGVIVLEGGRQVQVTPGTQIIVGGQPARLETIRPGTAVVIQPGQPAMQAPGTTTVVTAPGLATAPLRATVIGVVTDIDNDGEITIKSNDGDEFEVKVTPAVAANLKKGDGVTIDLNFHSPSAAPRLR